MIAKVRTRTRKSKGMFADLAAYISQESKAIAIEVSPAILSAETAAIEMELVAEQSSAGIALYHFVLSWPQADQVQNNEIFSSVRGALENLGFGPDEFQWVSAIHGDSEFRHAHTLVNRVHPQTLRVHSPSFDYRILDRFCREEEASRGWTPAPGLYRMTESGLAPRDDRKTTLAGRAQDLETWTGHASFQRWLQKEPANALRNALERDPGWETVHRTLVRYGVAYEPKNAGAIVINLEDRRHCAKAGHLGTDLSRPRLEDRLGPFQAARAKKRARPYATYQSRLAEGVLRMEWTTDERVDALYRLFQHEQSEWRTKTQVLRAQALQATATTASAAFFEHRQQISDLRMAVGSTFAQSAIPRSWVQAAIGSAHTQVHGEIKAFNREQRAAVRSAYRAPNSLFRKWLRNRAREGDAQAALVLTQLRSGVSADHRVQTLQPIERVRGPLQLGRDTGRPMADIGGWISSSDGVEHVPFEQWIAAPQQTIEHDAAGGLQPLWSSDWTNPEPTWPEITAAYDEARRLGQTAAFRSVDATLRARHEAALAAQQNAGTELPARDLRAALCGDTIATLNRLKKERGQSGGGSLPTLDDVAQGLASEGKTLEAYENKRREREAGTIYAQRYGKYISGIPTPQRLCADQVQRERDLRSALDATLRERMKAVTADRSLSKSLQQQQMVQMQLDWLIARDKLNQTIMMERNSLKELLVRARVPTYEEFLLANVEQDPAARGVLEDIKREVAPPSVIDTSVLSEPVIVEPMLRSLKYTRDEKTGVTVFVSARGHAFEDRGDRINCETFDAQSVRVQLMLVRERFASGITVGGSEEYQRVVLREAARLGIRIANPELQERFAQELAAVKTEREQAASVWTEQYAHAKQKAPAIFDTAEQQQAAFSVGMLESARIVALERGYLIEGTEFQTQATSGIVRDAWQIHGRAFVVVRTGKDDALLEVEPSAGQFGSSLINDAVTFTATSSGHYQIHTIGEPALVQASRSAEQEQGKVVGERAVQRERVPSPVITR
jgi:hypothetical protein